MCVCWVCRLFLGEKLSVIQFLEQNKLLNKHSNFMLKCRSKFRYLFLNFLLN